MQWHLITLICFMISDMSLKPQEINTNHCQLWPRTKKRKRKKKYLEHLDGEFMNLWGHIVANSFILLLLCPNSELYDGYVCTPEGKFLFVLPQYARWKNAALHLHLLVCLIFMRLFCVLTSRELEGDKKALDFFSLHDFLKPQLLYSQRWCSFVLWRNGDVLVLNLNDCR